MPSQAAAAAITGRVVIELNRELVPVRRAKVTSSGSGRELVTDTDVDGRFSLRGLPPGEHRLRVEKPGFVHFTQGPHRLVARTVAAGRTEHIEIRMQRGAALEGRVVDAIGAPLADIAVSALRIGYGGSGRRAVPIAQALTDDLGRFRIHSLQPGQYFVDAAPEALRWASRAQLPGELPTELVRMYYPGTPRLDEAQAIALASGDDVAGLDFQLTAVGGGRVSGRVGDATGRKPASFSVRIQRVGGPPDDVRGVMLPPPENTFIYGRVPPGEYFVMASAIYARGAAPEFAIERVVVLPEQALDLSLTTSPGARVAGRIEADGGALPPLGGVQIVAHQLGYELPSATQDGPAAEGRVDADGTFGFTSLAGRRLFRVTGLPTGWALARVLLSSSDITDRGAEFTGGSSGLLRVIVTSAVGTVTGTTKAADGAASPEVRVVVFSADRSTWRPLSRFVRTTLSAATGRFTIPDLLPGEYFVAAVEYLDEGAWEDPAVLDPLRVGAVAVDVGARSTQDLVVAVGGSR